MINSHKTKLIKQLALELSSELDTLPVTVLPNGDIVYELYLIKQTDTGHWELQDIHSHDTVFTFWLKSCALLAAYFYNITDFTSYREVKWLDREYYKNKSDSILFAHCLKTTKDFDQKVIFLNRLECSQSQTDLYKRKISRLFKRTFV